MHHLKESHVFWISEWIQRSPVRHATGFDKRDAATAFGRNASGVSRQQSGPHISNANGRKLTFNVAADDAHIQEYLIVLRHLLTRRFLPLRQITVETINEENASRSPFVDVLRISFDVLLDYKHVVLYRKVESSLGI